MQSMRQDTIQARRQPHPQQRQIDTMCSLFREGSSVPMLTSQGWLKSHPREFMQLCSCNLAKLTPSDRAELLDYPFASQFHVTCLQDAKSVDERCHRFDQHDIAHGVSRGGCTRIHAGGPGVNIIRECFSEPAPHCDFLNRPCHYEDPVAGDRKQCLRYLVAGVCAYSKDSLTAPLVSGAQHLWRVCSLHYHREYSTKG